MLFQLLDVVKYHAEHFVPFIRMSLEVAVLFNFTSHGNGSMTYTVSSMLHIVMHKTLCI